MPVWTSRVYQTYHICAKRCNGILRKVDINDPFAQISALWDMTFQTFGIYVIDLIHPNGLHHQPQRNNNKYNHNLWVCNR